jgi:acetyltransferase
MSVRNLDKLFDPAAVVLIGRAPPRSPAAIVARNLARAGFRGPVMRVDPHSSAAGEEGIYPDLASLSVVPDLAVIAAPPETVPPMIADLGRLGTRAAIVIAAFGPGRRELRQAMLDAAKPYLLRILGPDSFGLAVPRLGLDASCSHIAAAPGDIAIVSQSGAFVAAMLDWAVPRGIGFSHIVALGETADVDVGDLLDHLAADPGTRAVLLYLEDLRRGRKLMSAARAAARIKPILVLKAGRSRAGLPLAESRLGAVVGDDMVCEAVIRRAGMVRVETMAELFDAAETLARTREQIGERLAILTNSGAAGLLAADALSRAGGRLAKLPPQALAEVVPPPMASADAANPLDIGLDASPATYSRALRALIGDRSSDAVLVLNCPSALADSEACAEAVTAAVAADPATLRGRNIFAAWLGEGAARPARGRLAGAGLPVYETPDSAIGGFLHRVQHRRARELMMETPPARPETAAPDVGAARAAIAAALLAGEEWLSPSASGAVLAAYGIPLAAGTTSGLSAAGAPGSGVALVAGLVDDPVFGPLVLFGQGGRAAAINRDISLELPPLNALLARRMIDRTRVSRLLAEGEGREAAVIEAVIGVLLALAQLACDCPELREILIDPLIANPTGVVAHGARMRVAPVSEPADSRLSIAPYPQQLVSQVVLRDGTPVVLRPLRPEDEPLLHDLAAHMSPEDLRLRFFTPVRGLTRAVAARLSQLDYDREMALVAEHRGIALGVVHYFADPDNRRAEYAIAVRSDWHGHGVGYLLMTRLIEIARQRGIGDLVGEVLRENGPMLQMCRELGFSVASDPDDPAIMAVGKRLAPD